MRRSSDWDKFTQVIDSLFSDDELSVTFIDVYDEIYFMKFHSGGQFNSDGQFHSGGQSALDFVFCKMENYYSNSPRPFVRVFERVMRCFFWTENLLREFFSHKYANQALSFSATHDIRCRVSDYYSNILFILYKNFCHRMEKELDTFSVFENARRKKQPETCYVVWLTKGMSDLIKIHYERNAKIQGATLVLEFIRDHLMNVKFPVSDWDNFAIASHKSINILEYRFLFMDLIMDSFK